MASDLYPRPRLVRLDEEEDDDMIHQLCNDCHSRFEATVPVDECPYCGGDDLGVEEE